MEDMHIHLKEGINSQKIFDKYIEKCILMNLKRVVFLDHGNRISPKHSSLLSLKENIDKFNNKIDSFNQSEKSNILQVIKGIEIDYSPNLYFREETKKILGYGNFEWIVGAIHSLKFNSLDEYLMTIIDMINNYNINVIAHLKLDDSYKEYENLLIVILTLCVDKNISIEINTSDRSRWSDEQLFYMLELMNKHKVNYVFSSDAHRINEIGYMIEETKKKVNVWKTKK